MLDVKMVMRCCYCRYRVSLSTVVRTSRGWRKGQRRRRRLPAVAVVEQQQLPRRWRCSRGDGRQRRDGQKLERRKKKGGTCYMDSIMYELMHRHRYAVAA